MPIVNVSMSILREEAQASLHDTNPELRAAGCSPVVRAFRVSGNVIATLLHSKI